MMTSLNLMSVVPQPMAFSWAGQSFPQGSRPFLAGEFEVAVNLVTPLHTM
jgi:hypothetical protein